MTRKVKSVSFNLADPFELEMYEHSQQYSNFSGYVKRLIQISMKGETSTPKENKVFVQNVSIGDANSNKELMKNLI